MKRNNAMFAAIVFVGWAATANGQTMAQREPIVALAQYSARRGGCCDPSPASAERLVAVQYPAMSAVGRPPLPSRTLPPRVALTAAPAAAGAGCLCAPVPESCYLPSVGGVEGCSPCVAFRPIVSLGAMPDAYYVGRGILGQPKLYVPGQPVRNVLRWLTP